MQKRTKKMKHFKLLALTMIASISLSACSGTRTTPCCDSLRKEYKPVVHFAFDSAELTLQDKHILQTLPEKLKKCPEVVVHITGYTDNIGTPEYNMQLGHERAASVQTYLMGMGINANRIHIKSKGEKDPMACNSTEEGRMQNRRAVVKFK